MANPAPPLASKCSDHDGQHDHSAARPKSHEAAWRNGPILTLGSTISPPARRSRCPKRSLDAPKTVALPYVELEASASSPSTPASTHWAHASSDHEPSSQMRIGSGPSTSALRPLRLPGQPVASPLLPTE